MIAPTIQTVEGVNILTDLRDVPAEVSRLRKYDVDVSYDVETTGLDPIKDRLVAIILKPLSKRAVIIDVRQFSADQLLTLGSMLEPLFDGTITLVGHNLLFDFEFAYTKMRLEGHKAYCTMLAEQVILGLGWSSAREKKLYLDMESVAGRYGIEVEKESRKWFPNLDQRPEEWNAPFPLQQIRYMKQDGSVPHKIKRAQEEAIRLYGLQEVIDLEMRDIFPTGGQEVWGVQIDKEGWLGVIDRVAEIAAVLERTLHHGVPESKFLKGYEGLDVHVLKVRNDRYMEKWLPYEKWMQERDAFLANRKAEWEEHPGTYFMTEDKPAKNWSEYKKLALDWWYEQEGKQTKPPTNKDGVNLGSWQQVRDGFNDLKIPNPEYDPKLPGLHPEFVVFESISEESLTPYIGLHPLIQVFIDYSHARKIGTVYGRDRGRKGKAFIDLLDETGRLRASYQQLGADSGRKCSYLPNFQQIPADGVGKDLRKHVVAAPGYTLVVADFSNIELRIVAELSGDKALLDAFAAGSDIHASVAGIMFGLTPEQATKAWTESHNVVLNGREVEGVSHRKLAKTCTYALLYGAGNGRLAVTLHVPIEVAARLRGIYYETFATAIEWLNQQKNRLEVARRAGQKRVYAETRSGRRRWFTIPVFPQHPANGGRVTVEAQEQWDLDVEEWKKEMGSIRRQLANHCIQGLSADITKLAECYWYEEVGYMESMRLIASIHDELIVEVKDPDKVMFDGQTHAEYAARLLEGCMMEAMQRYLQVVDLGQVKATITPYWQH